MYFLAWEFSGIVYGAFQKARPSNLHSVVRFTEPSLVSLLLYENKDEPKSNGVQYVTYVNDGINLLRNFSKHYETVLTMDMMNPFPFALGRKPAIGGIAAAAYNYTLSDAHRPSDNRYFGNTDLVMVPKHPASPNIYFEGFYRVYKSSLHAHFQLATESDMWYLYRRK